MTFTFERMRHKPQFRMAAVKSKSFITPKMLRIIFETPDFEGFISVGFDDHIRLFFPKDGEVLPIPQMGDKGTIWPEERPAGRDYTPRYFDATKNQMTIDFVVHDGGIASDWASSCDIDDVIGIGGPRGSFVMTGDADWHVLAGDETALPAIGRRIEELPKGTKILALVEIADEAEKQSFETQADVEYRWLLRSEGATLLQGLEAMNMPVGEVFVFAATEAETIVAIRELMAKRGLPEKHLKASNYWRKKPK